MIRFNILGQILDLYANTDLQFVRKNMLFAFDDIEIQRTAEFQIPATPNNNSIFGLSNNPANMGNEARISMAAQLQYEGGAVEGYLHISKCNKQSYNCIFTFGELSRLKEIRKAGKLVELAEYTETATLDSTGVIAASQIPRLPLFGKVAYQNGHIMPTAQDIVTYEAGYFPLPSIGLKALAERCLSAFGVTLNTTEAPTADGVRLTIAQPMVKIGNSVVYFSVVRNAVYDIDERYFRKSLFFCNYSRDGQQGTWNMVGYEAKYDMNIKFANNFPVLRIVTVNAPQSYTELEPAPLKDKEISLTRGQRFAFVIEDMLPTKRGDFGVSPVSEGAYTYTGLGTVEVEERLAQTGEIVRLVDNMPDITLVELLKILAATTNTCLFFEGDTVYLKRGIDGSNMQDVAQLYSIDDITRNFNDWAQKNVISFEDNEAITDAPFAYYIQNVNIAKEKELLQIPFSRPAVIAAVSGEFNAWDALVLDNEYGWNEDKNDYIRSYPASHDTLIQCADNDYAEPLELAENNMLQTLCEQATSLSIQTPMTLKEYNTLSEFTLLNVRGQLYVWTEVQWQGGVASFQLSKYTPPEYGQVSE